jgi:hypothetical protein
MCVCGGGGVEEGVMGMQSLEHMSSAMLSHAFIHLHSSSCSIQSCRHHFPGNAAALLRVTLPPNPPTPPPVQHLMAR